MDRCRLSFAPLPATERGFPFAPCLLTSRAGGNCRDRQTQSRHGQPAALRPVSSVPTTQPRGISRVLQEEEETNDTTALAAAFLVSLKHRAVPDADASALPSSGTDASGSPRNVRLQSSSARTALNNTNSSSNGSNNNNNNSSSTDKHLGRVAAGTPTVASFFRLPASAATMRQRQHCPVPPNSLLETGTVYRRIPLDGMDHFVSAFPKAKTKRRFPHNNNGNNNRRIDTVPSVVTMPSPASTPESSSAAAPQAVSPMPSAPSSPRYSPVARYRNGTDAHRRNITSTTLHTVEQTPTRNTSTVSSVSSVASSASSTDSKPCTNADTGIGLTANVNVNIHDLIRDSKLVFDKDRDLVPDALFVAMAQMDPCRLTQADRVGCYKSRNVGFLGMCCRHCGGQPGFGRYFPNSVRSIAQTTTSQTILKHIGSKCRFCPPRVRQAVLELQRLQTIKDAAAANTTAGRPRYGSRKIFFQRIWSRLHTPSNDAAVVAKPESTPTNNKRRPANHSRSVHTAPSAKRRKRASDPRQPLTADHIAGRTKIRTM